MLRWHSRATERVGRVPRGLGGEEGVDVPRGQHSKNPGQCLGRGSEGGAGGRAAVVRRQPPDAFATTSDTMQKKTRARSRQLHIEFTPVDFGVTLFLFTRIHDVVGSKRNVVREDSGKLKKKHSGKQIVEGLCTAWSTRWTLLRLEWRVTATCPGRKGPVAGTAPWPPARHCHGKLDDHDWSLHWIPDS